MADSFRKLRTSKDMVRKMPKKLHFRTSFDSQHNKGCQTLLKSARQYLYHVFPSLSEIWSQKMSLLLISKIFGLFASTLTADDKYSCYKREHILQAIQMQLCKKLKSSD